MRILWRMLLLGASLVLLFLAAGWCGQAKESAGRAAVFLTGTWLDKKTGEEICRLEAEQEEGVSLCFWGEKQDVTVSCQETGKSVRAGMVVCTGNPGLLIPGGSLLAWRQEGCLVDEKTAEELFGSRSAGGQTLWYQEAACPVLGTFESVRRTVVRMAGEEDGSLLLGAVLEKAGEEAADSVGQQFLLRHGLDGQTADFGFLWAAAENMLLLLPFLFVCSFCRLAFRAAKRAGSAPGRRLLFFLTAAAGLLFLWFLFCRLEIPKDMIPSRWSDFAFWGDWWERQKKNLLRLFSAPLGEAQLTAVWNLLRSLLCSLAAAVLGAASLRPAGSLKK